jgi:hypothetical protein
MQVNVKMAFGADKSKSFSPQVLDNVISFNIYVDLFKM